jgi:serine O-acetyltransferase
MATARDLRELQAILAADWAREANCRPAQQLTLLVFRVGQLVAHRRRKGPLYLLWRLADLFYLRALLGAELSPAARVGPGLALPHAGRGVVIGHGVVIGGNSMIFWRVTIGPDGDTASPRLGDDVSVGAGACIIGDVSIGSRVRVGPNSVVLDDIPSDATAFGVPARYLRGLTSPRRPMPRSAYRAPR